jgi:hypothetical protein
LSEIKTKKKNEIKIHIDGELEEGEVEEEFEEIPQQKDGMYRK